MFLLSHIALPRDDVSWRLQSAVYGIGLFSTSIHHMSYVVVPLYVATLDPSPLLFGLVLGARHFLPLLLSIHAGALMDRLGARRLMIAVSALGVAVPLLFPAAPWIWAVLVFQMLAGLTDILGWQGAQTMIGQYMHGRTVYAGRLTAVIRIGHFFGPPMAGAAWDMAGPWGAFSMLGLWGLGMLGCALMLPGTQDLELEALPQDRRRLRPADFMPSARDYGDALRLLAVPGVAVVVVLGSVLHVGNSIQGTFFIAWLEQQGITGTAIGTLISVGAIGGALFSLCTASMVRRVSGFWILLCAMWVSVLLICATPLLPGYALLVGMMFLKAGAVGLGQPLTITLVLSGAGASNQGKAVGLRGTVNRIASIACPVLMGGLAEFFGLEYAFYGIAAIISVLVLALAAYLWRRPEIVASGRD